MTIDPHEDTVMALLGLDRAFQKHNIPVPDQLSYSDRKEGQDARAKLLYSPSALTKLDLQDLEANHAMIAGFKLVWGRDR